MTRVVSGIVCLLLVSPVQAEIKLLAVGKVPGNATDLSNLTEILDEGTPHNRLGGIGSAIAHIEGDRFLLLPDRGPKDGASTYQCRFQIADLSIVGKKIELTLKESVILRDIGGRPLLGDQFNLSRRLDPEGARLSPAGTVYISDEYGPKLIEFDRQGKHLREFKVPDRFLLDTPSGDPKIEAKNKKGRSPNRGFEGLARTPAGKLVAALQSPLLQDGGFDGLNARILELDLATKKTREFVYPLGSTLYGVNEILALSETEFLVLERDTALGENRFCRIFRISTAAATDVSGVDALPARGLPKSVTPVTKTLFLDLTKFGLMLPEKVEGICFGRDLADGRRLLFVSTDNDFTEQPSYLFAFSVDPEDLK
jgi:hypothetical protein